MSTAYFVSRAERNNMTERAAKAETQHAVTAAISRSFFVLPTLASGKSLNILINLIPYTANASARMTLANASVPLEARSKLTEAFGLFDTPSAIVSRSMYYVAQDLPSDWLERYWSGVQEVTPESIRSVFAQHLRPNDMTILVVGDPEQIGLEALERLGPVTRIEVR